MRKSNGSPIMPVVNWNSRRKHMPGKVGIVAAVAMALMAANAGAATIKVDAINDELNSDGDCSLREAVQAANVNHKVSGCAKGEGKRDTVVLKGQAYSLSITSSNEAANANGDLDVTGGGPLTVLGKGSEDTSVSQSEDDRVFDVTATASDLTLDSLRVSGGDAGGFVGFDPRGGNVRATNGKLTLDRVETSVGDAVLGGALYAGGAAKVTVQRSRFLANDADSASTSPAGGAIAHDGTARMKIISTSVQGSQVSSTNGGHTALGGAIYANGPMTIDRSLISGNGTTADTDNVQENGGGIYHASDDLKIVNTTIFNNIAGGPGDNDGDGGAIFNNAATATVEHVTFGINDATDDGDQITAVGGLLTASSSIIEGDAPFDPCAGGFIDSGGFNVGELDDGDCDYVDSDNPETAVLDLGSLSSNGGPTDTIPITASSAAHDFVPKGVCKDATGGLDQRGFERPKGPKCDAGAFEFGAKKP